MVTCGNGKLEIKGNGLEIMADMSMLLIEYHKSVASDFGKEFADDKLDSVIKTAREVIDNDYDPSILTNGMKEKLDIKALEKIKKDLLDILLGDK